MLQQLFKEQYINISKINKMALAKPFTE